MSMIAVTYDASPAQYVYSGGASALEGCGTSICRGAAGIDVVHQDYRSPRHGGRVAWSNAEGTPYGRKPLAPTHSLQRRRCLDALEQIEARGQA